MAKTGRPSPGLDDYLYWQERLAKTASPVEIELPNGGLVRLPVGVGQAVIVDVIQAETALQTRRKPS